MGKKFKQRGSVENDGGIRDRARHPCGDHVGGDPAGASSLGGQRSEQRLGSLRGGSGEGKEWWE
jgi:hypothetical protein